MVNLYSLSLFLFSLTFPLPISLFSSLSPLLFFFSLFFDFEFLSASLVYLSFSAPHLFLSFFFLNLLFPYEISLSPPSCLFLSSFFMSFSPSPLSQQSLLHFSHTYTQIFSLPDCLSIPSLSSPISLSPFLSLVSIRHLPAMLCEQP